MFNYLITYACQVVHPSYNFFTYENDLALLKLENPVNLSSTPHIVPICLPGSDDLLIGENATVTGWGRLSEGGQLPNTLQFVQVPIISNDKCRDMFLKSGRMEHIPEIFLCAGYDNGGRDSCQVCLKPVTTNKIKLTCLSKQKQKIPP